MHAPDCWLKYQQRWTLVVLRRKVDEAIDCGGAKQSASYRDITVMDVVGSYACKLREERNSCYSRFP